MPCKKYYILHKYNKDCADRAKNGEELPFESDFGATAEKYAALLKSSRAAEARYNRASLKKLHRNTRKLAPVVVEAGKQPHCCIRGCHQSVTNRLRFSLRCLTTKDFLPHFLEQEWNKVCHYHYFSDLYKFKKKNGPQPKASGVKRKRDGTGATQQSSSKRMRLA